jgi:hypothetical protein
VTVVLEENRFGLLTFRVPVLTRVPAPATVPAVQL